MKDFTTRWPIGAWEKGLMSMHLSFFTFRASRLSDLAAVLELGALFGALASGILADRFSRRHSIFFACGMHNALMSFIYSSELDEILPLTVSRILYWLWVAMWSAISQRSGAGPRDWWFWRRSPKVIVLGQVLSPHTNA